MKAGRQAATVPAAPTVSPWWLSSWAGAAAIAVLVLAVYWPVAGGSLNWDDGLMLSENPFVRSPDGWWKSWIAAPGRGVPDYFPLTTSAFWLQYHLWGLNPGAFHVVNVALHLANGLMLWRLLTVLRIPGAWLVAALFAVHPANVPSVAWIAELKNTLSLPFYLGTLLAWLRFEDAPAERRWRWYALALVLFALGCLAKSSVVVLPPVLLLLAWWRRGRIARPDVLWSLPFFALALVAGLVTMHYQYRAAGGLAMAGHWPLAAGLAVAGRSVWFYLAHDLMPLDSCAIYPRWEVDPASLAAWLPTLSLVPLFALLLWNRRTPWARALLFGLGYFVITRSPLLGILPSAYNMQFSFVADHWQYLSLAGLLALPVAAGVTAARRLQRPAFRAGLALLASAVLAVFSALACRYAWFYSDALRLWRHTMEQRPDLGMAYNVYAEEARQRGRCSPDEAAALFQTALRLNPRLGNAWFGLAVLRQAKGDLAGAAAGYRALLKLDSGHYRAGNNLAWILAAAPDDALRNPREAEALVRRMLNISGTVGDRYNLLDTLAVAQAANGDFAGAAETARQAVELARETGVAPAEIEGIVKRKTLYEKGIPYRDTPPAPGTEK